MRHSLFSPETTKMIKDTRKMGDDLKRYLDELRKKRTLDLYALPRKHVQIESSDYRCFESSVTDLR
jgi:hypothetical protein